MAGMSGLAALSEAGGRPGRAGGGGGAGAGAGGPGGADDTAPGGRVALAEQDLESGQVAEATQLERVAVVGEAGAQLATAFPHSVDRRRPAVERRLVRAILGRQLGEEHVAIADRQIVCDLLVQV